MKTLILASAITLGFATQGCSTALLQRGTLDQAATLTDIQYQIVLDNIAMFKNNPDSLPWHVKFTSGTITANNQVAATGTYQIASVAATSVRTITRTAATTPQGSLQQAWGIVPVVSFSELKNLQVEYRRLAKQEWVHSSSENGDQRPAGALVGRYKGTTIWVSPADLGHLTEATLDVLTAVPVTSTDRGFMPSLSQPSINAPN